MLLRPGRIGGLSPSVAATISAVAWILSTGSWNDNSVWNDTASWKDAA